MATDALFIDATAGLDGRSLERQTHFPCRFDPTTQQFRARVVDQDDVDPLLQTGAETDLVFDLDGDGS